MAHPTPKKRKLTSLTSWKIPTMMRRLYYLPKNNEVNSFKVIFHRDVSFRWGVVTLPSNPQTTHGNDPSHLPPSNFKIPYAFKRYENIGVYKMIIQDFWGRDLQLFFAAWKSCFVEIIGWIGCGITSSGSEKRQLKNERLNEHTGFSFLLPQQLWCLFKHSCHNIAPLSIFCGEKMLVL